MKPEYLPGGAFGREYLHAATESTMPTSIVFHSRPNYGSTSCLVFEISPSDERQTY